MGYKFANIEKDVASPTLHIRAPLPPARVSTRIKGPPAMHVFANAPVCHEMALNIPSRCSTAQDRVKK